MSEEKLKRIEEFLKTLGEVPKNEDSIDGFDIICKKCGSRNVIRYDETGCGSEYTGMWGDAGLKCLDCGNAKEIMSY